MEKHGKKLWIYDVPQNEPFVTDSILYRMFDFDQRMPKPKDQKVEKRLLPLLLVESFSFLEYLKCISPSGEDIMAQNRRMILDQDTSGLQKSLANFEKWSQESGMLHLNENGYTPARYVQDFKTFVKRSKEVSNTLAVSIKLTEPASPKYNGGKPEALTDLLVGETDYRYNWLVFEGNDLQATLDVSGGMGMAFVSSISVSFLQDQASWVFLPEKVIFEFSPDGENFFPLKEVALETVPDEKKTFQTVSPDFSPTAAVAIRVTAINRKVCPEWHTCNGNPCWIFADEITVK
jgi:hypothetical protein